MKDIIPEVLGRRQPVAFLSGPTFARELMEGQVSAAVVAADTPEIATRVQALFQSPAFRVYRWVGVGGGGGGGIGGRGRAARSWTGWACARLLLCPSLVLTPPSPPPPPWAPSSLDVVGVEIGGALKNVLAIAAGVCEGLGYGQNTKAMLVTRGLAEMNTFARALGADPGTLAGLAGTGDVMLTCMGTLSRNLQARVEGGGGG